MLLKKKIDLKINEKNGNNEFPLTMALLKKNTEMVEDIIENADKNNIVLNLTEISGKLWDSFFTAVFTNNVKNVQLLFNYAIKNHLDIKLNSKKNLNQQKSLNKT